MIRPSVTDGSYMSSVFSWKVTTNSYSYSELWKLISEPTLNLTNWFWQGWSFNSLSVAWWCRVHIGRRTLSLRLLLSYNFQTIHYFCFAWEIQNWTIEDGNDENSITSIPSNCDRYHRLVLSGMLPLSI